MRDTTGSRRGDGLKDGPRRTILSRRALLAGALQSLTLLAACAAPLAEPLTGGTPATRLPRRPHAAGAYALAPTPISREACLAGLQPVIPPTPIPYPGYSQEEPSTGLHVTAEAQSIDLAAYRLAVTGKVDHPLSLAYDELRCLPKVQAHVRLECPGFFVDESNLAGTTMASVLALAGPQSGATRVRLTCAGGYSASYSLDEAMDERNFLAYEWEGEPLPPSHGFPLRSVIPGTAGSEWAKWVTGMELT